MIATFLRSVLSSIFIERLLHENLEDALKNVLGAKAFEHAMSAAKHTKTAG
jgi:hypothetical protein